MLQLFASRLHDDQPLMRRTFHDRMIPPLISTIRQDTGLSENRLCIDRVLLICTMIPLHACMSRLDTGLGKDRARKGCMCPAYTMLPRGMMRAVCRVLSMQKRRLMDEMRSPCNKLHRVVPKGHGSRHGLGGVDVQFAIGTMLTGGICCDKVCFLGELLGQRSAT